MTHIPSGEGRPKPSGRPGHERAVLLKQLSSDYEEIAKQIERGCDVAAALRCVADRHKAELDAK